MFLAEFPQYEMPNSTTINHPVKYANIKWKNNFMFLADPSYANKIFVYFILSKKDKGSKWLLIPLLIKIIDFGNEFLIGFKQ